ncbi:MAG: hypothetical protein HY811_12160 [Planctomycetes bacterium]|nr:hypothetical protein [Planctomycetota bacterium]
MNHKRIEREYDDVFAIIRADLYCEQGTPIEHKITVKKVVWSADYARHEINRLSNLNIGKGVYFYLQTRLFRLRKYALSLDNTWKRNSKYSHVFAIVKYDIRYATIDTTIKDRVSIEKIVRTEEEVAEETGMLNKINANTTFKYFWTITRLDIS